MFDDDGSQMYCTICSAGDSVFICDTDNCNKCEMFYSLFSLCQLSLSLWCMCVCVIESCVSRALRSFVEVKKLRR